MTKEVFAVVKSIAISLLIAVFIINFLFQIVTVNGESMVPTVQNNDKLIIEKVSYRITSAKRNDIVVIKYPADISQRIIKRVIAVAGDKVKINNNILYINDEIINEHYKNENFMEDYNEVLVPQDSIFVLGDNRNFSKDSRSSDVGFVKLNLLEGKAVIRLYPFNKMGGIK
ncbi:signal peptidase I [Clostridium sp. CM028]|uniref:signal peptidase I n=1 Tax=unclassified Clostridium TaxID=2614128 RepID=UPI001C6DE02A|nr:MULTISPECIES: signal peptidase I [unclassified Clostridium]MBW9144104.1 signal peptidase I [Clostridium sp. CM027]MBW9147585.1 signal peptidase I [Clostridium sp. CM028]UVE41251.1 signal peptidase I [Clostridium sp. CM027]WLC61921.1 signal peptidase I [Clostridium sp. CM028]